MIHIHSEIHLLGILLYTNGLRDICSCRSNLLLETMIHRNTKLSTDAVYV